MAETFWAAEKFLVAGVILGGEDVFGGRVILSGGVVFGGRDVL